jgi:hypothetical protein
MDFIRHDFVIDVERHGIPERKQSWQWEVSMATYTESIPMKISQYEPSIADQESLHELVGRIEEVLGVADAKLDSLLGASSLESRQSSPSTTGSLDELRQLLGTALRQANRINERISTIVKSI